MGLFTTDKGTCHMTMDAHGNVSASAEFCEGHKPCKTAADLYRNHPAWAAGYDAGR
jgi:hypothetical protein